MRALVLTDEATARAIDSALTPHGYHVERADQTAQVEAQARRGWALIVLDWDLLGAEAPDLCRALVDSSGATLLALARDATAILPAAVAAGADDALELPRDERRLVARALAAARMVKGRAHEAFVRLPLPSWIFDEQTLALLAVNDAMVRHYGWSREELAGMSLYDLRPPEEKERLAALVEGKPKPTDSPWTHWRKDGSRLDVEVLSAPLAFSGRRARIAVARDVSEHVREAERNRQSLADYHALVERMPDGCVTYRPDGLIAYVNQALLDFLGYRTSDELIGRHCLHMIHPDDHELVSSRMRLLISTLEATPPGSHPLRHARRRRPLGRDARHPWALRRRAGGDGAGARSDRAPPRRRGATAVRRALLQDLPRQPRLDHDHAALERYLRRRQRALHRAQRLYPRRAPRPHRSRARHVAAADGAQAARRRRAHGRHHP